jgi:hypothetical protein
LLAALALVALLALWALRPWSGSSPELAGTPLADLRPLPVGEDVPTGRLWFVGEADLQSIMPASVRRADSSAPDVSSWLFIWNPGQETARVTVRAYSATTAPSGSAFEVEAQRLLSLDLAARSDLPRDQPFWLVVDADRPVFPQARHARHRPWDPVPDTLTMVMPHPGPLGPSDVAWIYPDGFQGGMESWEEREVITLLNPGTIQAHARIAYRFRDERPARIQEVVVPPERVLVVDVARAFGDADAAEFTVRGDYAVLVTSDQPLMSQQGRRATWRGDAHVGGVRPLTPIRVATAMQAREWYHAGGWVQPQAALPRDPYLDHTWQLLFTHNLDERSPRRVAIRVHDASGAVGAAEPVTVPPARSDLQWLHRAPWRGTLVPVEAPWALVLKPDGPIAPDLVAGEYEPWSQGMPGAMGATALVPGPLTRETEWWLGVAEHGGDDTRPVDWEAAWQVFNPGDQAVQVTFEFLGLPGDPRQHRVLVAPGAVARVTGHEVAGLPVGVPFVVRAVGDRPFVAHAWQRVWARGVPGTRALASAAGLPIALPGVR